jgi:hypothetical protein
MLKGFILSEISNDNIREASNAVWKVKVVKLKSIDDKGDEIFIKAWLRSQYAETIRENKAGAVNKDFDIIGGPFHKWVREEKEKLGLIASANYEDFIKKFSRFADIYAYIRSVENSYNSNLKYVYYNAKLGFTLQTQIIMAAIDYSDNWEVINEKISIVSEFIDYMIVSRVTSYRSVDYSTIKNYVFNITKSIRRQEVDSLKKILRKHMIELDFKYFHFDFGSSTVFPKRFEIGYMFPLINMVEYQNHIGDYDNTAMFGDIKVKIPEYGSIWASLYLDEINGLNNNPFTSTRAMYAGQLGTKILFPWLPFANISMRYTKIEPYCYTHHAINYTPWYNHYIIENYTNNGESLGYYLPPNSDEFFFKFEAKPKANLNTSLQYQFIRHGAEYGSQQVPGSSLYSELSPYNRDELNKYFLRDGAYNWMHIISVSANIQNKKSKVPFMLYGTAGFMYSYYTMIDSDIYNKRHEYGNNGNSGADSKTVYHFVNTDEYPVQFGGVLSLGIKLFYW